MGLTDSSINILILSCFIFNTASIDYNAVVDNLLTFTPEVNILCATVVPIIDDDVLEDNQTFTIVLRTSDPDTLVNLVFATVTILDNDGKIHLALSKCDIHDVSLPTYILSSQVSLWVYSSHPTQ